ncbi:MAG: hypothetical protein JJU11_03665 [Candidatus Sumerlaeia bacterium]|nr:hypothetical protein [Candidatus Sumerlaeia bacterium]
MFTQRSTMTSPASSGHQTSSPLREGLLASDLGASEVSTPRSLTGRNPDGISTETQRVLILLGGGVIGLVFLLLLAQSMNPSDDDLISRDIVAAFAPLDGVWVGQVTELDANGKAVQTFREHREFHPATTLILNSNVTRIHKDGRTETSVWVMREHSDGSFTSSLNQDTGSTVAPFRGSIDNGHYFWQRRHEDVLEIHRMTVMGNSLHIEEIRLPADGNGDKLSILSGRLQRMEMVDH